MGLLRSATLWIMLLALPWQSLAAAWTPCSGHGHAAAHRAVASMEMPCHSVAVAEGSEHDRAHPRSDLPGDASDDALGVPGDSSSHTSTSTSTCSACAACHMAWALLSGALAPEPSDAVHAVTLPPGSSVPSHPMAGLERPPRALSV